MAGLVVVMAETAGRLDTDGFMATTDPVKAANNRPCFLVVPPVVDYAGGTFTTPSHEIRVMALAAAPAWGVDALDELDTLTDHAAEQLAELQRAEPTLYRLSPDRQVPAYLLTFNTL